MDVYWGKRKFDIIGEGDEPEEIDNSEKKEDKKKKETKSFIPPLEHTKLFMSNIATDGNHIYFYSEVSRIRMLELNRALEKVNLDLMKKNLEYGMTPPIYLHIHSYGGSVLSCFSTIDTILSLDTKVVSVIEGAAASAATMISIVCDERRITPHSYMLIHQLSSGFWGKMDEIEDEYTPELFSESQSYQSDDALDPHKDENRNKTNGYQPLVADVSPKAQMIQGFKEGVKLLKVGDKATLFVPYNLAYGESGTRGIPPKSDLIFEIEILDIIE